MTANSSVEFLIWLLIAASVIAVIAKRIGIPYTVALVFGGLLLSVVHLPALAPLHQGNRPDWLTPDVILTLFLPALLFEGSLRIDLQVTSAHLLIRPPSNGSTAWMNRLSQCRMWRSR